VSTEELASWVIHCGDRAEVASRGRESHCEMEKFYAVVPSPNRPWEVVEVDDALHPPCERLESAWKLLAGLAAGIRDAAKMIKARSVRGSA
jgi:hypothetical protein